MFKFGMFDWIDLSADRSLATLYEERIRIVQAAEAAGFYAYHLAEHHSTPLGSAPSPNIFLAALTQRTSKIQLIPTVYLLPMYSPFRLSEEIAMLDQLSNGRFQFGVGAGSSPYEARAFSVDMANARDMMREGIDVLLAALRTKSLGYEGSYYAYRDVATSVVPVQSPQPPVWYAVGSPSSISWAAKNRLNILSNLPAERTRPLFDSYEEERAAGIADDPINPQVEVPLKGLNRQIFVAKTEQDAERIARGAYDRFLHNFTKLWHDNGDHLVDRLRSGFDIDREHGHVVVGSVAQVQDLLADDITTAGANYISGSFAWGDLTMAQSIESIELFGSEVAPALDALAPALSLNTWKA